MTLEMVDRFGNRKVVENFAADTYRIGQMLGHWSLAGEVCCRLGIANPYGPLAERREVQLVAK